MTVSLVTNISRPISSALSQAFAMDTVGKLDAYGKLGAWSTQSLFKASEQGVFFDPSDLSTMFQDATGTTPVTADGQPVGLILDKSKGLVLGSTLNSNSSFDSGMSSWSAMANGTVDTSVSGQVTVSQTSTGATTFSYQAITTTVGKSYKCTFVAKGVSGNVELFIGVLDGSSKVDLPDVDTGQPQTVSLIFTASTTNPELRFGLSAYNTSGAVVTLYSATIQELLGNHASQATAAARPLYKTDGTYHWLQFDGVDDSLSTAAIDFTGTDKMSVFAGVYRNGNGVIVETGVNRTGVGAFGVRAITSELDSGFNINGFGYKESTNLPDAPQTEVVYAPFDGALFGYTGIGTIRVNGSNTTMTPGSGAGNSSAGYFGNHQLRVGSYSGGGYFNGNTYPLIVVGKQCAPEEIDQTEAWVNGKTGAF